MWITLTTLICATHIFIQQCWGIKFIDLPGFGSEENKQSPLELMQKSGSVSVKEVAPDQIIVVQKPKPTNFDDLRRRLNYESEVKVEKDPEPTVNKNQDEKVKYESYSRQIDPGSDSDGHNDIGVNKNLHQSRRSLMGKQIKRQKNNNDALLRQMRRVEAPQDMDENLKHKIATLVEQTMHDTDLKVKHIMRAKEKHREKPAYKIGFILSMVKKTRDVLNELFNVAVKHRDDWKALDQLKVFEIIVHTNVDTTNLVRQLVEVHIQTLNASDPNADPAQYERSGQRRVVVLKK